MLLLGRQESDGPPDMGHGLLVAPPDSQIAPEFPGHPRQGQRVARRLGSPNGVPEEASSPRYRPWIASSRAIRAWSPFPAAILRAASMCRRPSRPAGLVPRPSGQPQEREDDVDVRLASLERGRQLLQQRQGLPVVGDGLRPRVELPCPAGGLERVGERPLPVLGPEPVMGEERRLLAGARRRSLFQVEGEVR